MFMFTHTLEGYENILVTKFPKDASSSLSNLRKRLMRSESGSFPGDLNIIDPSLGWKFKFTEIKLR